MLHYQKCGSGNPSLQEGRGGALRFPVQKMGMAPHISPIGSLCNTIRISFLNP